MSHVSAFRPFLFTLMMDRLTEEVRQEFPWTAMFADDIVISSDSREEEENLEKMWRSVLERRGINVSSGDTEYECVREIQVVKILKVERNKIKRYL